MKSDDTVQSIIRKMPQVKPTYYEYLCSFTGGDIESAEISTKFHSLSNGFTDLLSDNRITLDEIKFMLDHFEHYLQTASESDRGHFDVMFLEGVLYTLNDYPNYQQMFRENVGPITLQLCQRNGFFQDQHPRLETIRNVDFGSTNSASRDEEEEIFYQDDIVKDLIRKYQDFRILYYLHLDKLTDCHVEDAILSQKWESLGVSFLHEFQENKIKPELLIQFLDQIEDYLLSENDMKKHHDVKEKFFHPLIKWMGILKSEEFSYSHLRLFFRSLGPFCEQYISEIDPQIQAKILQR